MVWGFKKRFELFGIPPREYVIPPSLEEPIENILSIIKGSLGSVVISGPLGSGKTSLISYLKHKVKRLEDVGVEVLSAQAVGSLSYLTQQFVENNIGSETFREFWKKEYGLYVPFSGSGRILFNRLMKCMKKDAESRDTTYLMAIDEFKPLLWARRDIRRNVIEHLAHTLNDKTKDDKRYCNLLLSLIQRPDQDVDQVFDQMLTISTRGSNVERSAFERRFRDIISLNYSEMDIAIIAGNNILNAKGINPHSLNENEFLEYLKPFNFEALLHAARMSGRNPGFCMLLLDDSIREAEKTMKDSNEKNPENIEIGDDTIDFIAKKRFEKESKRLADKQIEFLRFLESSRKQNEIILKLNQLNISTDDIEGFISDLHRRGLIEKTKDDHITTTMLWLKGSRYNV